MSNGSMGKQNYFAGCMIFVAGIFVVITVLALVSGWFLHAETSGIPMFGKRIALSELDGEIDETSRDLVDEIDRYGEDASVRALVLRIDSPGGLVAPSQELYEAVRRFRANGKPVVVSMASVCASGGYYVACAADTIVANPGTLTASIGVILSFPTATELMKKVGVKWEFIKSGRVKAAGSTWKDLSQEERDALQSVVDDTYGQFVDAVSEERGLERKDVLAVADGRALTGRQAVVAGLADTLGDLQTAVDIAARMAGITGKPNLVRKNEKPGGVVDWLRKILDQKWQGPGLLTGRPGIRLEYRLF